MDDLFQISALLITLAAVFNYANYRFLKLPTTIGIMALALAMSLVILLIGSLNEGVRQQSVSAVGKIHFDEALMNGMLGLLLFAGALHVDLGELNAQKGVIAILATVGVLVSTFITGFAMFLILPLLGIEVAFIHCLLFGALIAPTDPIAVLGVLKNLSAPKSLETKIAGESLFNDGIGVVVFLAVLGIAGLDPHHPEVTAGTVIQIFVQEALGGAVFGLVTGYIAYRLLKSVDDYQVEVLISLALVMGGYALAQELHLSGPIAMVVAGLLIGNPGRDFAMSEVTLEHLDTFWELVDEILNAILFVLIGLQMLVVHFSGVYVLAGVIAVVVTLLARFIAVAIPVSIMSVRREFSPHAAKVLTWGGLRGGISVALALYLGSRLGDTYAEARDVILVMTYVVVVFSILVQGLTIKQLIGRLVLNNISPTPVEAEAPETAPGEAEA